MLVLATSIDGEVTVTVSVTDNDRASEAVSVLVSDSVFINEAISYFCQ